MEHFLRQTLGPEIEKMMFNNDHPKFYNNTAFHKEFTWFILSWKQNPRSFVC